MYYEYISITKQVLISVLKDYSQTEQISSFFMSVFNYLDSHKKSNAFLFPYFPFLFQLKSKDDYYHNDNIRLSVTFESGFKIFRS